MHSVFLRFGCWMRRISSRAVLIIASVRMEDSGLVFFLETGTRNTPAFCGSFLWQYHNIGIAEVAARRLRDL